MKAILSAEGRGALEALAARRALLAFDFDGTLAPIVPDRHAARVGPDTRRLLREVSSLYPCAVVSGRARTDVAARLEGIPLFAVVGAHRPAEARGADEAAHRARVLSWLRALKVELSLVPGIEFEDKGSSLAVHYRSVPSRAAARSLAMGAAAALRGARVLPGRAVVNVVACDAPGKRTAVECLLRRAGPRPVLYVGDDGADEDVFRSAAVDVSVRVGRTARSAARWYVARQPEVDDLLRALVAARNTAAPRPRKPRAPVPLREVSSRF